MTPASLFARRDRLAAALRAVEARLDTARREWSDQHGYRVPVRTETFRREVGYRANGGNGNG